MTPHRPATSMMTCTAAAFAGAISLTAGLTAPADATTPTPVLSATARAHGLTSAGDAVPGWTQRHRAVANTTTALVRAASLAALPASGVPGVDVSPWSGGVNWRSLRRSGARFAYVKATEGTYYRSGVASGQLTGARRSGMYVGAYHFANPSQSSGMAQADYFIAHSGGWRPGKLPGAVDLEWNPYSGTMCYSMTRRQITAWIGSFQREYRRRTGIWPVIYTARAWWNACVGNSTASATITGRSELWLSTPGRTLGNLPYPWTTHRIWQYAYASSGYDIDLFHGSSRRLARMARTGR